MTRSAKLLVTLFAGDSEAVGARFHRCQAFPKSSLHARTHAHVSLPEAVSLVALVAPATRAAAATAEQPQPWRRRRLGRAFGDPESVAIETPTPRPLYTRN